MICRISDLIVEVPATGGMSVRCIDYLHDQNLMPDIIITAETYRPKAWPQCDYDMLCYMESGIQFYAQLLKFNGMMLHASAVELEGRAYLFSGPCGMGKSTHTRLWQQTFGEAAQIFNDDKPALRCIDGKWYAYGTPWCGKDGINQNKKVPLAGICFLQRGEENEIRSLPPIEATTKIISQTRRKFREAEYVDLMLENIQQLVRDIPVFELKNRPMTEAALLSHETMRRRAEELGL